MNGRLRLRAVVALLAGLALTVPAGTALAVPAGPVTVAQGDGSGLLGLRTPPTLKASSPYYYSRSYSIQYGPHSLRHLYDTNAEAFSLIRRNLASLFPISGMANNPVVGQVHTLSGGNPVRVTSVTATSFSLVSLPGHWEGANNKITFSVINNGLTLRVVANGPVAVVPPRSWAPDVLWPAFAVKIASRINPGMNPYSGSWR